MRAQGFGFRASSGSRCSFSPPAFGFRFSGFGFRVSRAKSGFIAIRNHEEVRSSRMFCLERLGRTGSVSVVVGCRDTRGGLVFCRCAFRPLGSRGSFFRIRVSGFGVRRETYVYYGSFGGRVPTGAAIEIDDADRGLECLRGSHDLQLLHLLAQRLHLNPGPPLSEVRTPITTLVSGAEKLYASNSKASV